MAHPWTVYEPTPDEPWNLRRVVHLHRRAGFAATWSEIQRDLADGPEASITRLLEGKAARPAPRAGRVRADLDGAGRRRHRLERCRAGSRPGGSIGCSSRPTRWASG